MHIECIKCGRILTAHRADFRAYAQAQGWTSFLIGTDEYWLCFEHGEDRHDRTPKKPA